LIEYRKAIIWLDAMLRDWYSKPGSLTSAVAEASAFAEVMADKMADGKGVHKKAKTTKRTQILPLGAARS